MHKKLKTITFTYEKSYFNSNSTRAWHISELNHQDINEQKVVFWNAHSSVCDHFWEVNSKVSWRSLDISLCTTVILQNET